MILAIHTYDRLVDVDLLADLVGIWREALTATEARLRQAADEEKVSGPEAGSAISMKIVLEAFEDTTPETGKTIEEAAVIARSAGMDPRGMAGYYAAKLLQADATTDSRWITNKGLARLAALRGEQPA